MSRRGYLLAFAVAVFLTSIIPLVAQETAGNLEGRLLDETGQVIPAATITAASPSLQGRRQRSSSPAGVFVFLQMPVGTYEITVEHPAFQRVILRGVAVGLGRTTALGDIKLGVKEYQENVEVLGRQALLDPATTATGGTLTAEQYAVLPIGRDYRSVATLLPQVNQSFLGDAANFAGSTGLENRYFIDGIDVTDPSRNVTGTSLPQNFVQEVQVRTGAYAAEYRSSLGGIVNAVTYSGGNTLAGQLFGFFANDRSAAESRLGFVKPKEFAHFDVGFGLGGPIRRDRLWYYLAYNPNFKHEDVEVAGQGTLEDRTTTHSFAAKLSWQASSTDTVVLTAIGDPTIRHGVGATFGKSDNPVALANPDPYQESIRTGGTSVNLVGRHVLRANVLLRASLTRAAFDDQNIADTDRGAAELAFTSEGILSGGVPGRAENNSVVTTVNADCTWVAGPHLLKGGLEYRDNRWHLDVAFQSMTRYSDTSYFVADTTAKGQVGIRIPSAFLQDSWRVTNLFRLNAGVRWDGQYIVSSEGRVAQSILDQWQPRVGFTWQPGREGSKQVSGSFARFFQELPTWPLWFYYNAGSRLAFSYYDHDPRVDPSGAEVLSIAGDIQPEIPDMRGQHFDEVTLAFERRAGRSAKVELRGVYRTLREALEDGCNPECQFNNPGRGKLSAFPRAKRNYSALQLSYQQAAGERLAFLVSYVLSRSYGNYTGLFNSDFGYPFPNSNESFDVLDRLEKGEGLLPNDRTHVFKLSGSYRTVRGLTLGLVSLWGTGTPLNELGGSPSRPPYYDFIQQRGTAGRTPSLWDVSLRASYMLPLKGSSRWRPTLTLDVLHIGGLEAPVNYDQVHYFNIDDAGNQRDPNPLYGRPTLFQPPMAVRLGLEVRF